MGNFIVHTIPFKVMNQEEVVEAIKEAGIRNKELVDKIMGI